jgi:hypothetical protein
MIDVLFGLITLFGFVIFALAAIAVAGQVFRSLGRWLAAVRERAQKPKDGE